jgi:hypothetical protein
MRRTRSEKSASKMESDIPLREAAVMSLRLTDLP